MNQKALKTSMFTDTGSQNNILQVFQVLINIAKLYSWRNCPKKTLYNSSRMEIQLQQGSFIAHSIHKEDN